MPPNWYPIFGQPWPKFFQNKFQIPPPSPNSHPNDFQGLQASRAGSKRWRMVSDHGTKRTKKARLKSVASDMVTSATKLTTIRLERPEKPLGFIKNEGIYAWICPVCSRVVGRWPTSTKTCTTTTTTRIIEVGRSTSTTTNALLISSSSSSSSSSSR